MRAKLTRGDLLPHVVVPPPGPEGRRLSGGLRTFEAPGINTLYRDQDNILWREAKGACVLDVDGNRYLDLTSGFGVAAVGHRHPKVVEALRRQSGRLIHGLGDAAGHPLRVELASKLRDFSGLDEAQTYFAISGADAVEVAIKTALLAQRHRRRRKILAFEPAYHGLTFGALAASSREDFRGPFVDHLSAELIRRPFGGQDDLTSLLEEGEVAAVLVEPIVGREGVIIPPKGWLKSLASDCRRTETLLLTDEIFTGFGRTGRRFAGHHEDIQPDLLICGKALAGGVPIGAVLGNAELMSVWTSPGEALHTATFVANPLACAAALATLDILEAEALIPRAETLGESIHSRLVHWLHGFSCLTDARGRGLLWGLELATPRLAATLSHEARRQGLLMLAGGAEGRVAQIVPPLTITERQLDFALSLLEHLLEKLEAAPVHG